MEAVYQEIGGGNTNRSWILAAANVLSLLSSVSPLPLQHNRFSLELASVSSGTRLRNPVSVFCRCNFRSRAKEGRCGEIKKRTLRQERRSRSSLGRPERRHHLLQGRQGQWHLWIRRTQRQRAAAQRGSEPACISRARLRGMRTFRSTAASKASFNSKIAN